ncbi:LTA synthase family protein [Pediococcus argentinicus]|uniref:LTA synthase family protein n=1 Tax=Pediococcus argentinicus TaxID=480391 RepID=UPI00164C519D|nr:LTA synthase family protein [Pediococcus argentinicus]
MKQKTQKFVVLLLTVFIVTLASVSSFSMWRFGIGTKRAILVENLMFLKPIISTLGLLVIAKLSQSWSDKINFKYWLQIVFYSLVLGLFAFGLVVARYSLWQLLETAFPVTLMSNTFAGAVVGILFIAPILNRFNNNKIFKLISLMGLVTLSVVPTIIWATHLVSPVQNGVNGLLWGMLITVIVKFTDEWNISKRNIWIGLGTVAVVSEILMIWVNNVNSRSAIWWSGFAVIKHLMFLDTNFFAFCVAAGIFLIFGSYFVKSKLMINYFIAATMVNTHFLFSKPMWNQIFRGADWLKLSGILMFSKMIVAALLVSLIIIGFEKLRQKTFEQVASRSTKWQTGIVSAVIVTLVSFIILLITDNAMNAQALIRVAGNKPLLMLLNMLALFAFVLIIYVLINRWLISSVVSLVLMIALAFGNYQKLISRNEPITPIDISSNIKNASEILDLVNIWLVVGLLIGFAILIGLAIFSERKLKMTAVFGWISRLGIIVVSGLILTLFIFKLPSVPSSSVTWKQKDKTTFNKTLVNNLHYSYHPESVWYDYKKNGPVLAFMSRIRIPIMDKPAGYSKSTIDKLATEYNNEAQTINKKRKNNVNNDVVIYILSESFANPNRVPGVKTDSDPIPYINSLKKNNTSGIMDSYGYGGGTADMEFEALSGMSLNNFAPALSTPYVELMPKVPYMPSALDLFKTKTAIHPYQPTLYNRVQVFKQFGFQRFYNTNNPYKVKYTEKLKGSQYVSDESAYKEVGRVLKENKGGQFIQLSTMQNHMPYIPNEYKQNYGVKSDGLTKNSHGSLETYTEGIHQSDSAMKQLIDMVNKDKRDVSIVFYGDHLPGLYKWQNDNDGKMDQYDSLLHQTDYFIYSNHNRQKVKKSIVAPYMFTPMMLDQTNSKLSGYYAFLTKCMQELPAGERGKYMLSDGKQIHEKNLSSAQKKLLYQYKLLQYDITAGQHYLKRGSSFFEVNK